MDTLGYDQVPGRATGLVLGDSYLVGRRLGRGAMGEVYEAQHVRLPGHFAVKLLLPELQGNQEAFARFCREAEIMSQLRHPNIVQIFDFNVAPDSRPYFVMEYLQGRDLEARLRTGPLPLPAVTRIVGAVASALALAHAHGVVHRDLKPANIFLATVDGQTDELVKVLDFGISKVRSAAAQISQAVDLLGTPSYMAPEQARGQNDTIDGRADQFALAAIAFRMLTGQDPFQGDDTAAVLYQVVHEAPPPLSMFLPPGWDTTALQAVLDRALAKQPERRFNNMMELARAFEDAAERTLGQGGAGGIGLAAAARAARAGAPRLDDAEIDAPPPVRTPVPLLKPIRRPVTPAPQLRTPPPQLGTPAPQLREPAPQLPTPALRPPPAQPMAPQMTWEVQNDIDVVPKTRVGGAVLGLLAVAIAGLLILTGWYKKLPAAASALRRQVHEWTGPSGSPPETRVEPTPPPAQAPPETPPDTTARPAAAPPPTAEAPAPAAVPEAPSAAPARPAAKAPEKPRAQRNRAARKQAAPAPSFAPPPPSRPEAPVEITPPANPPLDGRAFEIAPPKTTAPGRDLAPPSDDTLDPSQ
jgi:serine/threonine-protein kinase